RGAARPATAPPSLLLRNPWERLAAGTSGSGENVRLAGPRQYAAAASAWRPALAGEAARLREAGFRLGLRRERHPVTRPVGDPEESILAARELDEEVGRRPVHELHEEDVRQRARHLERQLVHHVR